MSTKPPPEIALAIVCMGERDYAGWRAAMRDAIGRYRFDDEQRASLTDRLTRLAVKQGGIDRTTERKPASQFFADAAAEPERE